MIWFRLASHLHLSLQRCKNETTSSEFRDWKHYLDWDINEFHREDYFFARISHQIVSLFSKNSKLEDHLIKFEQKKLEPAAVVEPAWKKGKSKFLAWAGIKEKE